MLTSDLVVRFLREKGVKGECPSCGSNEWLFSDEKPIETAQLLLAPKGKPRTIGLSGQHVPLVVLACKNCAHVRIYAKGVIELWAESLEGTEGASSAVPPKENADGG